VQWIGDYLSSVTGETLPVFSSRIPTQPPMVAASGLKDRTIDQQDVKRDPHGDEFLGIHVGEDSFA